jgi:hypothetical protein
MLDRLDLENKLTTYFLDLFGYKCHHAKKESEEVVRI